jgi:hypothetical protein
MKANSPMCMHLKIPTQKEKRKKKKKSEKGNKNCKTKSIAK